MTSDFQGLIEEEWQARLRFDPLQASSVGDHRYNHLLPVVSETAYVERLTQLHTFHERWQGIPRTSLSEAEQLNYDLFGEMLKNEMGYFAFREYRMPINKTNGFYSYFPYLFASRLPQKTISDYENLIARLRALPTYIAGQIEVMQVGLDTGYIPAAVTLDGLAGQISSQLVNDARESLFFLPFKNFPPSIAETERKRLEEDGRLAVLEAVLPAYQQLLLFVEESYLPAARKSFAAADLPDGTAYYRYTIRNHTSLELLPEEIHQIGLEEVAEIRSEMESMIAETGFSGGLVKFSHFLRTESRFYPETAEELLKEAAYIVKRVDGQLPKLFKTLPRMPYGVVPMPDAIAPGNTTARYSPPSGDGTRAREYWVNITDLKSRPLYEMQALDRILA
jgi:uncharacterized protein (DUF885 family)